MTSEVPGSSVTLGFDDRYLWAKREENTTCLISGDPGPGAPSLDPQVSVPLTHLHPASGGPSEPSSPSLDGCSGSW